MGPFYLGIRRASNLGAALPAHYSCERGQSADEKELRAVIGRSFVQDASWGDAIHEVNGMLDCWLERAFAPEKSGVCLALRHGLRMIGASILVPDSAAGNHLAPGPCVQIEYRNRGLGTALLGESLRRLREAGVSRAGALTKNNGPAAKFLYPKFNGVVASRRHAASRCLIIWARPVFGAPPTSWTGILANDPAFALLDKAEDRLHLFALPNFSRKRLDGLRGVHFSTINQSKRLLYRLDFFRRETRPAPVQPG